MKRPWVRNIPLGSGVLLRWTGRGVRPPSRLLLHLDPGEDRTKGIWAIIEMKTSLCWKWRNAQRTSLGLRWFARQTTKKTQVVCNKLNFTVRDYFNIKKRMYSYFRWNINETSSKYCSTESTAAVMTNVKFATARVMFVVQIISSTKQCFHVPCYWMKACVCNVYTVNQISCQLLLVHYII